MIGGRSFLRAVLPCPGQVDALAEATAPGKLRAADPPLASRADVPRRSIHIRDIKEGCTDWRQTSPHTAHGGDLGTEIFQGGLTAHAQITDYPARTRYVRSEFGVTNQKPPAPCGAGGSGGTKKRVYALSSLPPGPDGSTLLSHRKTIHWGPIRNSIHENRRDFDDLRMLSTGGGRGRIGPRPASRRGKHFLAEELKHFLPYRCGGQSYPPGVVNGYLDRTAM